LTFKDVNLQKRFVCHPCQPSLSPQRQQSDPSALSWHATSGAQSPPSLPLDRQGCSTTPAELGMKGGQALLQCSPALLLLACSCASTPFPSEVFSEKCAVTFWMAENLVLGVRLQLPEPLMCCCVRTLVWIYEIILNPSCTFLNYQHSFPVREEFA